MSKFSLILDAAEYMRGGGHLTQIPLKYPQDPPMSEFRNPRKLQFFCFKNTPFIRWNKTLKAAALIRRGAFHFLQIELSRLSWRKAHVTENLPGKLL